MTARVFFLVFSVLLISEAALGKPDCEKSPFHNCERPKVFDDLPREVSEFYLRCQETKTYMRCMKEYQDECGTDRIVLFESSELFEATYNTITDVCQEGTLFNLVATSNLKCFSDTLSNTKCRSESEAVTEPLITAVHKDPELGYSADLFCLSETITHGCVARSLLEKCGRIVEQATLDFMIHSKSLEYACSVAGAKSVLDNLDGFRLNDDQRNSVTSFLEKLIARNSDEPIF